MPSQKNDQDWGVVVVYTIQLIGDILLLILKSLFAICLSLVNCVLPKQPKSVRGEIVLVTGAGHGIGKELALLYAAEGATVVVWDINENMGQATVKEIAKRGYPKAHFYRCDVSKREDVLETGKKLQQEIGDVTILINNAGIMPTHPLLEHTTQEIERIMNINVMAHYWTLQVFLPSMKQNNHGHIVCLSSTAGMFGVPNLVPYCASKFAVRGLMEALSEELRIDRKNEVKLTSIYPYMVNTGLCKNPRIRFEKLMPLVNPTDAAKEIMYAQRHDIQDLTIPRYYMTLNKLLRLLPVQSQHYFKDFIGVSLDSDLN